MKLHKRFTFWFTIISFGIGIVICLFIVGGTKVYFNNTKSSDWKEINSFKEYEELLNSPITEIRLRKTIDSDQWAVFTDSDLIEKWTDYLHELEVMRENRITKVDKEVNGGRPVIDIKTQNSKFTLVLRGVPAEYKFEIDGYFYAIKNPRDIPFSETYDTAVERHGIKSPWD